MGQGESTAVTAPTLVSEMTPLFCENVVLGMPARSAVQVDPFESKDLKPGDHI
jgi:hypothetical protein